MFRILNLLILAHVVKDVDDDCKSHARYDDHFDGVSIVDRVGS